MRFTVGLLVLPAVISLCGSAYSQALNPPATAPACEAQAAATLQPLLPVWQKRLQLTDWKITLLISAESDLKPNTLGNIHWDAPHKSAVIRVLHPSGYTTSCTAALQDMQTTLVHELVHLSLSSLPRTMETRKDEESAVNRITAALLLSTPTETADTATSAPSAAAPAPNSADRKATNAPGK